MKETNYKYEFIDGENNRHNSNNLHYKKFMQDVGTNRVTIVDKKTDKKIAEYEKLIDGRIIKYDVEE